MSNEVNITINGIAISLVTAQDRSRIHYDDTWQLIKGSQLSNDSGGSDAYAGKPGSTLSIDFTGIALLAVSAFPATLPPNANQTLPNVTVTLDKRAPTRVSASASDPFYTALPLDPGAHTFSLTVNDAADGFPFIFGGFAYFPVQDIEQAYDAQAAAASPTQSGSDSDSGLSRLQLETLVNSLVQAKPQASGPPVAAIVGGTVGIIILLSILATAVWYFYIRPRRKGGRAFFYAPAKAGDMLKDEFDLEPEPYPLLSSHNGRSRSPSPERAPTRQSSMHAPSIP